MTDFFLPNLLEYRISDHLLPELVDRIGCDKSNRAVSQALDLQKINGNLSTIPVLISETCGLCLTSIDIVKQQIGLRNTSERMVLIISLKRMLMQLISN